jgi:hypothetical protein
LVAKLISFAADQVVRGLSPDMDGSREIKTRVGAKPMVITLEEFAASIGL